MKLTDKELKLMDSCATCTQHGCRVACARLRDTIEALQQEIENRDADLVSLLNKLDIKQQEIDIQTINAKTYLQECEQLKQAISLQTYGKYGTLDYAAQVQRLQAQNRAMREALEEAAETIENMYGTETKQTEQYRGLVESVPTSYHNSVDVETLAKVREALNAVFYYNHFTKEIHCGVCGSDKGHTPECKVKIALEQIDKAGGGEK